MAFGFYKCQPILSLVAISRDFCCTVCVFRCCIFSRSVFFRVAFLYVGVEPCLSIIPWMSPLFVCWTTNYDPIQLDFTYRKYPRIMHTFSTKILTSKVGVRIICGYLRNLLCKKTGKRNSCGQFLSFLWKVFRWKHATKTRRRVDRNARNISKFAVNLATHQGCQKMRILPSNLCVKYHHYLSSFFFPPNFNLWLECFALSNLSRIEINCNFLSFSGLSLIDYSFQQKEVEKSGFTKGKFLSFWGQM